VARAGFEPARCTALSTNGDQPGKDLAKRHLIRRWPASHFLPPHDYGIVNTEAISTGQ